MTTATTENQRLDHAPTRSSLSRAYRRATCAGQSVPAIGGRHLGAIGSVTPAKGAMPLSGWLRQRAQALGTAEDCGVR